MPTGAAFALGTPYTGPLGVAMIPKTDFRILWPIPNEEVVNNPTLAKQQNPVGKMNSKIGLKRIVNLY
jgi:hypothetical protein